jgi:EAL domain-containing protein (putative c-di-GMP-specific phosphodiesterase class I)
MRFSASPTRADQPAARLALVPASTAPLANSSQPSSQLAAAIRAGEIVVHYQPILSLADLRCTAVEALLRWQHPRQGLIPAAQFITRADSNNGLIELGSLALRSACAYSTDWQSRHPGVKQSVHVNVSINQLDTDEIINSVDAALTEFNMPPQDLVVELTKSAVYSSPAAIGRIRDIAALGVRIAANGFRGGYSTLATLRSLPISIIKLDRTFVSEIEKDPTNDALTRTSILMSSELGLQVIAEGVERTHQQQLLAELGVDAVQGHLYLRPVPARDLNAWRENNMKQVSRTTADIITFKTSATH